MNILFLISFSGSIGGTEVLARNLFEGLKNRGHNCLLLSENVYITDKENIVVFPTKEYKRWKTIRRSQLDKLFCRRLSDYIFRKMVNQAARENNIDWVVSHSLDMVNCLPTNLKYKTAQIIHWSISGFEKTIQQDIEKKSGISRFVSLLIYKNTIKSWHNSLSKVSKVVLLTNSAKKEITHYIPNISENQISIIPDSLVYSEKSDNQSSLDNKTIVFVGRLAYEKGVMRLLSIWRKINSLLPDYRLLIYGDGHAKSRMLEYIQQNKIHNVSFKGFTTDIEKIYANADLCLMTSDTEGFGMVLIEAMYYGVPCVSFDCPVSPKEIIADAGITVSCFDEEEYANQVVNLLRNPERMKQLQQNAIRRAKDFYIDKVMDKWMTLLNS